MPFRSFESRFSCTRYLQNRTYECCPCRRTFDSKAALLQHLFSKARSNFHDYDEHTCKGCKLNFKDKEEFYVHLNVEVHMPDFHQLCCSGKDYDVKKLIRNADSSTVLHRKGYSHKSLLGENIDSIGCSPVHCAANNGHYIVLKILLSWDADPDLQDSQGQTPLHIAILREYKKCAELLINSGANLFILDDNNCMPFDYASPSMKMVILQQYFHLRVNGDSFEIIGVKQNRIKTLFLRHYDEHCRFREMQITNCCLSDENLEVEFDVNGRNCQDSELEERNPMKELYRRFSQEPKKEEKTATTDAPLEILARGDEAIRAYYHALEFGKVRLKHVKLGVLGPVGAGKTSLVKTLSGEEFNSNRTVTEGIQTRMVESVDLDTSWKMSEEPIFKPGDEIARQAAQRLLRRTISSPGNHCCDSLSIKSKCDLPNIENLAITDVRESPIVKEPVSQQLALPSQEIPIAKIATFLEKETEPANQNEQFKVTIWDFAGHYLYEPMHHIFLNTRSMYLIVFSLLEYENARETTLNSLSYWMNSVAVHTASNTAVFIVGTHSSDISHAVLERAEQDINNRFCNRFMNNIVFTDSKTFIFPVENSNGPEDTGALMLKKAIEQETRKMTESSEELPLKWLKCEEKILDAIEKDPKLFHMSKMELIKGLLHSECITMHQDMIDRMLEFFHDIGLICVPEILTHTSHGSMLKDLVILNPQHLVDAMALVCNLAKSNERSERQSSQILRQSSRVNLTTLENILEPFHAPTELLVDLLRAFNVLCPIPSPKSSNCSDISQFKAEEPVACSTPKAKRIAKDFLIPFLLKQKSLKKRWEKEICRSVERQLVCYVDFHEFVPESVFHQLLVKLSVASQEHHGFPAEIRRHAGIFCLGTKARIMLELLPNHCQIKVCVSPDYQEKPCHLYTMLKTLLTDICENFFRYLKFHMGPPCPKPDCPGSDYTGSFIKYYSSSSEDEINEVDGPPATSPPHRVHVLPLEPDSCDPIYCQYQQVQDHEKVKLWKTGKAESFDSEFSLDSDYSRSVSDDSGVGSPSHLRGDTLPIDLMQHVASQMGDSWEKLAYRLQLSFAEVENIRADYRSQESQASRVLQLWCQKLGQNATKSKLKKNLEEVGRKDISFEMK